MQIKTAGGEVFNSVDEMLQSSNRYIRGLAESIKMTVLERERHIATWIVANVTEQDFLTESG